jgi:predicted ATPase
MGLHTGEEEEIAEAARLLKRARPAATRVKFLTPVKLLPRLRRRLSLLTTGARTLPDRQRTLRGAVAWSHDLLAAPERRLFERLSVFAGGWTLESAEAVADPAELGLDTLDALTSLVDQSLVTSAEAGGQPRFAMLETIREFGRERLEASGELAEARRRHAGFFLDLADAAGPELTGPDQGEWLDRCDLEHANLRAALDWAVEAGETGRALTAATALWRFWQQRGHLAGAAEALRERLGGRVPLDFLGSFVGDPEAESRAHLPTEVADRAFAEGRALSVDDAMALATGAT